VADALHFGERRENTEWCLVVLRDPKRKENLWWGFSNTETTSVYLEGRRYLENLGYDIKSITGDGFSGLRQAFSGIPFQMCHVHMERIVIAGTTRKPELESGRVLLAMIRLLHSTGEKIFRHYVQKYLEKYRSFLNERTIHPVTGEKDWTHKNLHKAVLSILTFLPFLFTYEKHKDISRTTNSIEGHFGHIRDIVEIHRGLSRSQKQKVLNSILLASTIAPSRVKLKHIL
jgi:hypothetical protein